MCQQAERLRRYLLCIYTCVYLCTLFKISECMYTDKRRKTFNYSTVATSNTYWPPLLFLKSFSSVWCNHFIINWPFILFHFFLFFFWLHWTRKSLTSNVLLFEQTLSTKKKPEMNSKESNCISFTFNRIIILLDFIESYSFLLSTDFFFFLFLDCFLNIYKYTIMLTSRCRNFDKE